MRAALLMSLGLICGLSGAVADAQSLRAADPAAPRLKQPQAPAARPAIASDPGQRPGRPGVPTTGPSVPTPAKAAPSSPPGHVQVSDRKGIPIPGAVEVAPNRVLDPRTGQVHSTMPTAAGAQVID